MRPLTILAICGSLRARSSNLSLLKAAEKLAPEEVQFKGFEGLAELPHFNPDEDMETPPFQVQQFRTELRGADGVIICTPEYAHGLPGSLKNAIDWTVSSGEWMEKPVLILNASVQSHFTHDSLVEILTTLMAKIMARPVGLPTNKIDATAMVEHAGISSKLMAALTEFFELCKT